MINDNTIYNKNLFGALFVKKISILIVIPFRKILTVIHMATRRYCHMQCGHFCNKTTSLLFLIVLNNRVVNTKVGFSLIWPGWRFIVFTQIYQWFESELHKYINGLRVNLVYHQYQTNEERCSKAQHRN